MIVIAEPLRETLRSEASQAYPRECCGLLIGDSDGSIIVVSEIIPCPNVAPVGIFDRFELDPQSRFDVMRKLADGPQQIIGHYHSHPDHQALPSMRDQEQAYEPDLIWVIVATVGERATDIRAHRVATEANGDKATGFLEIPLLSQRPKS